MLSPLRLIPLFRRYLWGGRRLETVLGKALPPGGDYAESWEVVDHGNDQSIVAAGPLSGMTLDQLCREQGRAIFGRNDPLPRFPLLFKFLDAQRDLSVQVHPNDEQAARLVPPDLGKTEAWVVLAAEPGSKLYTGLRPGIDRQTLASAIERGEVGQCLHRFEPRVGDAIFIPAGTVHAIGAGLVIAEIQQSSDTTFRLFDWNRVDTYGQPRPLHIQEALDVIDFDRGPVEPEPPELTNDTATERLVQCEKFILDRHSIDDPIEIDNDERFHIISVIEGAVELTKDPAGCPLRVGETVLLPASRDTTRIVPIERSVLLDMYLP